jgi:hypothetical protein
MKWASMVPVPARLLLFAAFLSSCVTSVPADRLGSPAPPSAAMYEISIGPETRHVNVLRDDIVTFIVGGKRFTWSFNDPQYWPVDLIRVAPPGILDRSVIAYVSPFRRYFGPEESSGL